MDLLEILKDKGYKKTRARQELLELLEQERDRMISAEELYSLVKDKLPEVNLSTLYRNLEIFENCGFLHRYSQEGKNLYKIRCHEDHHHHLICNQCGKVISLDYCPSKEMETLAKKHRFKLTSHVLELYGLCEDCDTSSQ